MSDGRMTPPNSEDEILLAREAELTKEVPSLLEAMNRSSEEVNAFEGRVSESQVRYRKLLEQWSRLYEDLRSQYGSAIDRVKPYFDAAQAASSAAQRVQAAVREFSAAASQHTQAKAELRSIEMRLAYGAHKIQLDSDQQDGLSRATVRVLKCQQERDRFEQDSAKALREYQEAQEALEGLKLQLGESLIKRTMPCFRQLQQHQQLLATEQQKITSYSERAQAAKNVYNHSLAELDRINVAVHTARRLYSQKGSEVIPKLPEERPEAAPEVTGCGEDTSPTSKAVQAVFGSPECEKSTAASKVISGPTIIEDDDCPFS